jgi:hypothetical protein
MSRITSPWKEIDSVRQKMNILSPDVIIKKSAELE